jgi:hypothetical protein
MSGRFEDLFLSDVAFVNSATAPIYGLEAADFGTELERTQLDPTTRPGFLTRVGFLSSYSHSGSTAPLLRGAYIMQHIVGAEIGPPDPDAPNQMAPDMEYTSNRQYSEVLTSPSECAVCHENLINPPGFVLEVYDAVGGLQANDPLGDPINGTADVIFGAGNTKTITTPLELMTELGKGEDAKHLYAEDWANYKISDVLAVLSQTEAFRLRTRGD